MARPRKVSTELSAVTPPAESMGPPWVAENAVASGDGVPSGGKGPFITQPEDNSRNTVYDLYAQAQGESVDQAPVADDSPPVVTAPPSEPAQPTGEPAPPIPADGGIPSEPAQYVAAPADTDQSPQTDAPAPATDAFLGTYKSRDEAEKGIKEKDATISRLFNENRQLAAQINEVRAWLQAQQQGQPQQGTPGQQTTAQGQPAPQLPNGFKELPPEEEEALLYSDFGKWRAYQQQREAALVHVAEARAFDRLSQGVSQAHEHQRRNQIELTLEQHFKTTHQDLVDMQPYVEAEAQRIGSEIRRKVEAGQLSQEDAVFWQQVYSDPRVLVDTAATRFREKLQGIRTKAEQNATATRVKLPENPVMAPAKAAPSAPRLSGNPDTPITQQEYMALRAKQDVALTNPWGA